MRNQRDTLEILAAIVGLTIQKVNVIYYSHQGEVIGTDCELQLEFTNGTVLYLGNAGYDGQSLLASREPWEDVFDEDISEATQDYINKYGKWVINNYTNKKPFATLSNKSIKHVRVLINAVGALSGIELQLNDSTIYYFIDSDEGHLAWSAKEINQRFDIEEIGSIW